MSRTALVAAVALLVIGHSAGAYAQGPMAAGRDNTDRPAVVRVDPLDAFSQAAAQLIARTSPTPVTIVNVKPRPATSDSYESYVALYGQYIAGYTRAQQQDARRSEKPGWMSAMQGISAGMRLSHEALDVYEHAVEAKALNNYYNGND